MGTHRSDKLESLGLSFSPDSCLNEGEKIQKKRVQTHKKEPDIILLKESFI